MLNVLKKCQVFAIFLIIAQFLLAGEFAGGEGTVESPYLVETPEHLDNVRNHTEAHFRQSKDIDLINKSWQPINNFAGVYDGNTYSISNLIIERPSDDNIGLFGWIYEKAVLLDIVLKDCHISGKNKVGSLVGYNWGGTLIGCYFQGFVSGEEDVGGLVGVNEGNIISGETAVEIEGLVNVGGMAGSNVGDIEGGKVSGFISAEGSQVGGVSGANNGTIIQVNASVNIYGQEKAGGLVGSNFGSILESRALGDVSANTIAGGLVGKNRFAEIVSCYATGHVSGSSYIGGLTGISTEFSIMSDSYASGSVYGRDAIGGLAGKSSGQILNSYAAGAVSGETRTGGLAGVIEGTVEHSYYDSESTGQEDDNGLPKTTGEMMQKDTFEDWDFEEIWTIVDGETYPFHQWVMTEKDYEAIVESYVVPAQLFKNRQHNISLTLRNTGKKNWEKGTMVYLGAVGDYDALALPENWRINMQGDVQPGVSHRFDIPVYPQETGQFTTEWQMLKEGEFWFGDVFTVDITVIEYTAIQGSHWEVYE